MTLRPIAVKIIQGTLDIPTKTIAPSLLFYMYFTEDLCTCSRKPPVENSSLVIFLAFESTSL